MKKNWFERNRIYFWMILGLTVGFIISVLVGKGSLQDFFSNFSAEIAGAIVTILFIDTLIRQQQRNSLKDVYKLVSDKIRLGIFETIEKVIGKVISLSDSDAVDLNSYGELRSAILFSRFQDATKNSESIFKRGESLYYQLSPQAYPIVKNIVHEQQESWSNFQIRFRQYLSWDQIVNITNIVDCLRDIHLECVEVEKSLQQRTDDNEKILLALQSAQTLVDDLKSLLHECLKLLREPSNGEQV